VGRKRELVTLLSNSWCQTDTQTICTTNLHDGEYRASAASRQFCWPTG